MTKPAAKQQSKALTRKTIQSPTVKPDNSGQLRHIGGSKSDDWNHVLVDQAIQSLWGANSDADKLGKQVNAAVAFMNHTRPADELEAMMAAQLFAAHNAAMECYRRAMIKEQPMEGRRENLNQANKLSRTYATLIETLNRHRGKGGQQKVTVEHVHVHEGGQAAIGTFNAPGAGGGAASRNEGQAYAKPNADAPEPALRCANPLGNVLPIASHAERPLSHARRKEPRCAER